MTSNRQPALIWVETEAGLINLAYVTRIDQRQHHPNNEYEVVFLCNDGNEIVLDYPDAHAAEQAYAKLVDDLKAIVVDGEWTDNED